MNVPDDLLYTESHEWIKREGENVRVGITDHAQSELTDVVYVELPKKDRQANAKEPIAVVESVKAASDIYAPVKGTVVDANKALESNPALINTDPFGEGWIFVLKIDNADDLKQLKDAAAIQIATESTLRKTAGLIENMKKTSNAQRPTFNVREANGFPYRGSWV